MTTGPNRVLAALVGVVVVVAIAAGVVASRRPVVTLDGGTPEGVTQAYVRAVLDDDLAGAAALLSPASGCGIADTVQSMPDTVRVVLESAFVDEGTAVVTLRVTDSDGDVPFAGSSRSHTERVTLARADGVWLVTGSSWLLPGCDHRKG